MIDVPNLLYEICEDKHVYELDYDLVENGLFDSLAFILFFSKLEDLGIEIQPTRIDRNLLRTPRGITKLVDDYLKENKINK